ncbi:MAG TPA: glycosyltransferase family 9 protein [Ramlibacter sp.]|uniref:glycosyltransferase family 9 protein n=1 Tax=Ramlibacter sp. TaxID=1917967 RepID=UPI002BFE5746|nr:glycosyltransferase family 9 protein [Ramlibacter sp.]HVZ46575.1 glycosyltransferase family 9 protein [Ramlibacter sp.]
MTGGAPGSVVIVVTRQIGDVLLTTPLLRRARELWPAARIDVLGFEGTLGMLARNPDVNEVIATPARWGLRGAFAWARRLWRRYDLALIAETSDRAHLIAWVAARKRSGIVREGHGSTWWKRALLAHAVASGGDESEVHVVREKLRLLEPWTGDLAARVVPPAPAPRPHELESQLREGRIVVLHVPSMWTYKQWDPLKFRAVAAGLVERGWQVVLTGTAGARDQAGIAQVRDVAQAPALLDASGQLDFNQLAGLLGRAALYIGPDTSVSHLAAAVGTPTLAVFGPTNPQRWGPWPATEAAPIRFARSAGLQATGNVTLIQASLPCVPCSRAGCEDHHASRSDCLLQIQPETVLAQALAILEGRA